MTKLLKAYYRLNKKFQSKKEYNKYADMREWSKAFAEEKANLLKQMSSKELSYLLDRTSGMARTVINRYLADAKRREKAILVLKDAASELVISASASA